MATRLRITPEGLGKATNSYDLSTQYYGVFLQLAHKDLDPKCDIPSYRLVHVVYKKSEMKKALRMVEKMMANDGWVLFHARGTTTLIPLTKERLQSPDYVRRKVAQLRQEYVDWIRFLDVDFRRNQKLRRSGKQDEARAEHDKFLDEYNARGWVKLMRAKHKIHPDIKICPGMHMEAISQTKVLRRKEKQEAKKARKAAAAAERKPKIGGVKALKAAIDDTATPAIATSKTVAQVTVLDTIPETISETISETDVDKPVVIDDLDVNGDDDVSDDDDDDDVSDDDDDDDEDEDEDEDDDDEKFSGQGRPVPKKLRQESYKCAVVSHIIDKTDDMEVLIWIHGVYASAEAATEHVHEELSEALEPLELLVVDMYQWVQPVMMAWHNTTSDPNAPNLKETRLGAHGSQVQETQMKREAMNKKVRSMKKAVRRQKDMDPKVLAECMEKLSATEEEVMSIMDNKTMGEEAVIALLRIENQGERVERTQMLLDRIKSKTVGQLPVLQ